MSVCDGKPCCRRDRLHAHGGNTAVVVAEPMNVKIDIDLGGGYGTQAALGDITTKQARTGSVEGRGGLVASRAGCS